MIYISQLWLSSVVRTMAVKVSKTYMCSHWKCTYLFQSFCWSCMLDCTIHKAVYVYTFYCLGNMLNLCAENFFVFFMLREIFMNCFAPNPLPPKHHMKFFCEQIKLRVPPCLIDPWNFHMFFLWYEKSMSSTVNPLSLVWIFSEIAHSLSPSASYQSPAELKNKGFG